MSFKIPYGRQHITEDDVQAVVAALKSDFLTQGPRILAFEQAFAQYVGAKYAVAVANGTAALHLCALAVGVEAGSKVITTPITFSASANCVGYCGGEVVFADVDPKTALLDIEKVKVLLEKSPKGTYQGIIPVDFAGYPINLEKFRQLADEYELWIIEDACHAPGGYFVDSKEQQQYCGNGLYADLAIFSFHPVKHIACGEGGMITTNDKVLYDQLVQLRSHGITKSPGLLRENHGGWYYEMHNLGYNYRLTDLQAALGVSQLQRADERIARRREIAEKYDKAFANTSVGVMPMPAQQGVHAYHLYVIQVNDRKGLYDDLRQHQIFAQVHYIPVHLQPYYTQFGWKAGDFPQAEQYYSRCLSLPMFPTLSNEEQDFVIEKVLKFCQ
ncbi:UDP-4-amino-4,6-dideoxy-N-acetyl-beta-L-altrosamine transaminase [Microscilla marina]|uniref:DegT/DnrJ/EryC1/StrS aminotransferase n=1 Tax=Microscilla marina ATCC 23134 TaxID=313606 RepID=A1ZCJ3_MICM2|nr:UDP-4-amino-4,6-dideoxy-N-acetyl-beta-L-altrosamine transaminase [Microscilla marina]EAY31995.1 DegT/DnrJ/EryC1/StrS aminotransferase [Microscilla marina ATCC 23134]